MLHTPASAAYARKLSLLTASLTSAPITDHDDVADLPEPDLAALTALILGRLDDDKAEDVVAIDLQGQSPLADTIIVASGRSNRHVSALADHILRALKDNGFGRAQVEGLPHADWVLIDAGDVIVHLFRPEGCAPSIRSRKIWSVDSRHRTSST